MLYREKKKLVALILVGLVLVFVFIPQRGQAADEYIMLMDADGAIVPAMENYFDRALDQAEEDNVALVIIQLDTPGGSVATPKIWYNAFAPPTFLWWFTSRHVARWPLQPVL
jgi:membrane-bound serine protease (ClpP class)